SVGRLVPVKSGRGRLWGVRATKTLFVSSLRDRSIGILDLRVGTQTSNLELNALPQDMVYDAARQQLLVSLQDLNQVVAVDRSGQITQRFKLVASEPTGLALDPGRRRLFRCVG